MSALQTVLKKKKTPYIYMSLILCLFLYSVSFFLAFGVNELILDSSENVHIETEGSVRERGHEHTRKKKRAR